MRAAFERLTLRRVAADTALTVNGHDQAQDA